MSKRSKIKYAPGGTTPPNMWTAGHGFAGTNVGQGLTAFGGLGGSLIEGLDQKDGHISTGGAIASGALKGVSQGAMFGPAGMLIGGAIGIGKSLMERDAYNDERARLDAAERDEERRRKEEKARLKREEMKAILDQYPVEGTGTPAFNFGGPTDQPASLFNTQYIGVPTFSDPMDRNAIPGMNWYLNGQQVSGQEMVNALPEGSNINDLAAYWHTKFKPRYSELDGWSNVGNNPDAMRANNLINQQTGYALGGSTLPRYSPGGPTGDPLPDTYNDPQPNMPMERELRYERGMPYYAPVDSPNGSIRQYEPSFLDRFTEAFQGTYNPFTAFGYAFNQGERETSTSPSMRMQAQEERDAMLTRDRNDIFPDWVYNLAGVEMAMGGMTGPQYEAEGGEMIQYKPGDRPAVYGNGGVSMMTGTEGMIQGPTHANGGVDMSDQKGARIYSNRLTVDPALMAKLSKL